MQLSRRESETDDVAGVALSEDEEFASEAIKVFKALSDRTRYEMIRMLVRGGEVCCARFAESFSLSGPALSHHYRVLESCGLIQVRKEGLHTFYRLRPHRLQRYLPDFERVHVQQVDSSVERGVGELAGQRNRIRKPSGN
jgi:DNA-binding transcriptional ArsR family regulator